MPTHPTALPEAIAEIERLQAENERLRELERLAREWASAKDANTEDAAMFTLLAFIRENGG